MVGSLADTPTTRLPPLGYEALCCQGQGAPILGTKIRTCIWYQYIIPIGPQSLTGLLSWYVEYRTEIRFRVQQE